METNGQGRNFGLAKIGFTRKASSFKEIKMDD